MDRRLYCSKWATRSRRTHQNPEQNAQCDSTELNWNYC